MGIKKRAAAAVPEGYTKLGLVGYSFKGDYDASATYNRYNTVYYEGSTYVALKDGLSGVTPTDGEDWKYLAKGFNEASADAISVIDTEGIVDGTKGKKTILQTMLDSIGGAIANKLVHTDGFQEVLKPYLVNNGTTTEEGFALDARFGKNLQDQVSVLNEEGQKWVYGRLNRVLPESGWVKINGFSLNDYDIMEFVPEYASQNPATYQFSVQLGLNESGLYVRNGNGSNYEKPVSGFYKFRKK